jgi:predicted O-methyltransferase YrrM
MKAFLEKKINLGNFKEKLYLNYHVFTFVERVYYWMYYRKTLSKEERFFFEGALMIPGQMYAAERKVLYDTIVKYKPRHCFEIGTADGGGSTYFIASAFEKLKKGKLYTLESYAYLYKKTKRRYNLYLRRLLPFVHFIFGNTTKSFEKYMTEVVDCLFLDGSDIEKETVDQYYAFLPHFKEGSILMLHDWHTVKTAAIEPILLSDPKWEKVVELKHPVSVGLVVFIRK